MIKKWLNDISYIISYAIPETLRSIALWLRCVFIGHKLKVDAHEFNGGSGYWFYVGCIRCGLQQPSYTKKAKKALKEKEKLLFKIKP